MSDLISRQDAIDAVFDTEPFVMMDGKHLNRSTVFQKTSDVIDALSALPSADAVEVVRCKECRYFKKIVERSDSGLCYRDLVASAWKENGHCSRGERKGGDDE